jgi:hypothetical protein
MVSITVSQERKCEHYIESGATVISITVSQERNGEHCSESGTHR